MATVEQISTQSTSGRFWPLERVLFLMAGMMTVLSALLAILVSSWFLLLTAFYWGINGAGMAVLAKAFGLELASRLTTGRALDAGPLASARALEGLTAVIVNMNRRYKGHAGIRVTGLP